MSVQTLNISLPKELVKRTDILAKKLYKSRSEFIRDALVIQLNEQAEWDEIFAEGNRIGKKMGIKSEEDAYKIVEEFRKEKYASQNRP